MSNHNEKDRPEYEYGSGRWLVAVICRLQEAWVNQDMIAVATHIDDLDAYSWIVDQSNDPKSQVTQKEFDTTLKEAASGIDLSHKEQNALERDTFEWHLGDLLGATQAMKEMCGGEETAKALQAVSLLLNKLDLQR